MSTKTSGAAQTTVIDVDFVHQSRLQSAVATVMETLCDVTGHVSGCALLNGRLYLFWRGDEPRLTVPVPTWRLWKWALGW